MLDQFSSVTQLCPTLYNPMDCSTPGFPVHHPLLELAQLYFWAFSNHQSKFPEESREQVICPQGASPNPGEN